MAQNLTYSGDLVHKHDHDRFLASLFAPADRRPALWALYAFNYEIARTREVVSDTTLGLIRLQWWRDAFAGIYDRGEVLAHDIVRDLAAAIKTHDLPRELFEKLLYAREFDLEDVTPVNMQGLENYADFTGTPLLQLALRIAGEDDRDAAPVAKAYALAGLLRAVPFHAGQRRCYLPLDLLGGQGISLDGFYAGKMQGLEKVIEAVAVRAEALLSSPSFLREGELEGEGMLSSQKVKQPLPPGPPPSRRRGEKARGKVLKVTAVQAGLWLKHLKKLNYNVFDSRMALPPPFYAARLWLRATAKF